MKVLGATSWAPGFPKEHDRLVRVKNGQDAKVSLAGSLESGDWYKQGPNVTPGGLPWMM